MERSEVPGKANAAVASVFSDDERAYILFMARQDASRRSRVVQLISSLAFFVPATVIGVFGLFAGDTKIIGIGFLVLLASVLWAYFGNIPNWRHEETGHGVIVKLAAIIEGKDRN